MLAVAHPSVGLLLNIPTVSEFLCPSVYNGENNIFVIIVKSFSSSPLRDTEIQKQWEVTATYRRLRHWQAYHKPALIATSCYPACLSVVRKQYTGPAQKQQRGRTKSKIFYGNYNFFSLSFIERHKNSETAGISKSSPTERTKKGLGTICNPGLPKWLMPDAKPDEVKFNTRQRNLTVTMRESQGINLLLKPEEKRLLPRGKTPPEEDCAWIDWCELKSMEQWG